MQKSMSLANQQGEHVVCYPITPSEAYAAYSVGLVPRAFAGAKELTEAFVENEW